MAGTLALPKMCWLLPASCWPKESCSSGVGQALVPAMLLGTVCFASTNVTTNVRLIAEPCGQKDPPEARQACAPLAQCLASLLLQTRGGGSSSSPHQGFITRRDRKSFLMSALEGFEYHLVFCPVPSPWDVSLSALTTLLSSVSSLKGSLEGWTGCSSWEGNNAVKGVRAATQISHIIFLFIHHSIASALFATADIVSLLKLSAPVQPVIHSNHRSFSAELLPK